MNGGSFAIDKIYIFGSKTYLSSYSSLTAVCPAFDHRQLAIKPQVFVTRSTKNYKIKSFYLVRLNLILPPWLKLLLLMYPVHQLRLCLWSLTCPYLQNSRTTLDVLCLHCSSSSLYIVPGLLHQCPPGSPCFPLLHWQHSVSRQRSCQNEFTRCFCLQYILTFLSFCHSKEKYCSVTNKAPRDIANFLFPSLTHMHLLLLASYWAINILCIFSPR